MRKARQTLINIGQAAVGLVLFFVVHIPSFIFLLLQLSYATVFQNEHNLTASTKEHLARAKKLLSKKQNSLLFYAALELRFALERITYMNLLFERKASTNMLKQYSPTKHRSNLSSLNEKADQPHQIYFVDNKTKQRLYIGTYTPIDTVEVKKIEGQLGDLLHSKNGITLGVSDCVWYVSTRLFLNNTLKYLVKISEKNTPLGRYTSFDQFELVPVEGIL